MTTFRDKLQRLQRATPREISDAVWSRVHYHFVQPVIGTIPRMVFGNDAGIRGNVRGRLRLRQCQRAYTALGDDLVEDSRVTFFRREGYLPLPNAYDPSLIDEIRRQYCSLIDDESASRWNGVGAYKTTSRAIVDPIVRIPAIASLLTEDIQRIVRGYYGSHLEVASVRAWRTYHVPNVDTNADAYSNQWHNDRFSVSLLRLFIYLSDGVTRETGAFRLHPIESTKRIVRSGFYLRRSLVLPPAKRQLEDERRIVYFEGDAGAACLANVQTCLHRAGIPKEGSSRDIVQITLRPALEPLSRDWARSIPSDRFATE
jgi:hypothetical protein